MQLISQVLNRLWFRHTANLFKQGFSKDALLLGVVECERFRFKIVNGMLILILRRAEFTSSLLHVNNTPLLKVFVVHVCVSQLFFTLFKRAS
jgi:hypothetical protein